MKFSITVNVLHDVTDRLASLLRAVFACPRKPQIHFPRLMLIERDSDRPVFVAEGDLTLISLALPSGFKSSAGPLSAVDGDGNALSGLTATSADPAIATAELGTDSVLTITDPPGPGVGTTVVTLADAAGVAIETIEVTVGPGSAASVSGLTFGAPVPRDTP